MCVVYPSLNLFLIKFKVMPAPCDSQDNPSVDTGRNIDRAIHQNCLKVDDVSTAACDTSHSHDNEELEGDQNDLVALDMLEAYSQVAETSQVLSYNI